MLFSTNAVTTTKWRVSLAPGIWGCLKTSVLIHDNTRQKKEQLDTSHLLHEEK